MKLREFLRAENVTVEDVAQQMNALFEGVQKIVPVQEEEPIPESEKATVTAEGEEQLTTGKARAELREAEVEQAMLAAAQATQALGLEQKMAEIVSQKAAGMEIRLTDLILAIEKSTGAVMPPAVSPDQGAYVTPYDEALIRNVLALKAQKQVAAGVVVVVMASSSEQAQVAHKVFRAEIRSRQLEVVMGGANAVAERLSRRYGRSRVQVKPGKSVAEDEVAYLTAALLANGRVVFVKTQETVQEAFQISVATMLEASIEAARAFAKSA